MPYTTLPTPDAADVLDFSAVERIDSAGLCSLQDRVAQARARGARLQLRGVNVDVYKTLKLFFSSTIEGTGGLESNVRIG